MAMRESSPVYCSVRDLSTTSSSSLSMGLKTLAPTWRARKSTLAASPNVAGLAVACSKNQVNTSFADRPPRDESSVPSACTLW